MAIILISGHNKNDIARRYWLVIQRRRAMSSLNIDAVRKEMGCVEKNRT
jgi:hypothetical protein